MKSHTPTKKTARWYKKHIDLALTYIYQAKLMEATAFSLSFAQIYPASLSEVSIRDLLFLPGMIEREARYVLNQQNQIRASMECIAKFDLGMLPELLVKKYHSFNEPEDLFDFYRGLGIQTATVLSTSRLQPDMVTAMFTLLPERQLFRFISIDEGKTIRDIMNNWLLQP